MLLVCMLLSGDVGAGSIARVEITFLGPGPVRLRVAQGVTFPCDSTNNRVLVDGKFNPGEVARTTTVDACVCVQQTFEPFPDEDWSQSGLACRPLNCTGAGRAKRCVPALDPTIRLQIRSKRDG
jgi:hypothetical protein